MTVASRTVGTRGWLFDTVPLGASGSGLVVAGGWGLIAFWAPATLMLMARGGHTRATGVLLIAGYLAVIPLLVSAA